MSARATGSRSVFSRWLASPPPPAALEISPRRVTAVAVGGSAAAPVLSAYATAPLPDGAIEAALNAPNVHDSAALAVAIKSVLDKLSPRPKRIGLVLPDTVAKVSLIRFEKVPARAQDLDQLIHWQVRKAAPFRIEDAQVSWVPALHHGESGREFLVTTARRDIIDAYEKACAAAGAYAGIVDLATFNLVNLVLAADGESRAAGDWLLVHVTPDYATLAVVRGGDVIFFRNRMMADGVDLPDLVHQTAMYHEDRLGGGGFTRIMLAGESTRGADEAERLRRQVEERIGTRAEPVPLANALAIRDRIAVGADLIDLVGPAAGLLLRERRAPRASAGGERVA